MQSTTKRRKTTQLRTPELREQGGGPGFSFPVLFFPPSLISHRVAVDAKHHEEKKDNTTQNSGAAWTGRWTWPLTPYLFLHPSLINHTVSADIKHHERRWWSGSIYSHKNMEWEVNEMVVFEEVGSLTEVLFHQGLRCGRVRQKAKSQHWVRLDSPQWIRTPLWKSSSKSWVHNTEWDWTVHETEQFTMDNKLKTQRPHPHPHTKTHTPLKATHKQSWIQGSVTNGGRLMTGGTHAAHSLSSKRQFMDRNMIFMCLWTLWFQICKMK